MAYTFDISDITTPLVKLWPLGVIESKIVALWPEKRLCIPAVDRFRV